MDDDWRDRVQKIAYGKMISASEIARKTGLSKATISLILSKKRNTSLDNIRIIAGVLGETTEYIIHGIEKENQVPALRVPLLCEHDIQAWLSAPESFRPDDTAWVNCFAEGCSSASFAMKVIDRDMIDPSGEDSFPPGTILFVDPELCPFSDGDEAAIGLLSIMKLDDGTIIFRKLQRATGHWYAAPKNPQYEPILIDKNTTKFVGTVLASARQYVKHNQGK